MITLEGKTALVTGAGSGIGAAIAEGFARAGATVVVADLDGAAAAGTVERILRDGGSARSAVVDVSSQESCDACAREVLAASGCDVLVNNAGIGHVGSILRTTPADMDRLWRVNVLGAYFMSRALLPEMIRRGSGSIIHIASIAGVMGMEARFAYTTTKHAVVGMTRSMAMDLGTTGVRVNCICPGRVATPFVEARLREYPDPEDYRRQLEAPHAMKRMARPSEIAGAALYLASDAASFVTGSAMVVDGGYSAGK
jgi:NAD(P)-dependent dehydrogenase (short-subunit alcohol dehydrogenase family)